MRNFFLVGILIAMISCDPQTKLKIVKNELKDGDTIHVPKINLSIIEVKGAKEIDTVLLEKENRFHVGLIYSSKVTITKLEKEPLPTRLKVYMKSGEVYTYLLVPSDSMKYTFKYFLN